MGVSLNVASREYVVGSSDFLRSFFSTIFVRVENGAWGARFPVLMNELYTGLLPAQRVPAARLELVQLRRELEKFAPKALVWDYENLAARPPWGDEIAPTITSLANYYWTSDGRPLLDVLDAALADAERGGFDVTIR